MSFGFLIFDMLTKRQIKKVAKRWANDSNELKKLTNIRKQIVDLYVSFADKNLTEEEKTYISRGFTFKSINSVSVNVIENDNLFSRYVTSLYPSLLSIKKVNWNYYLEIFFTLGESIYGYGKNKFIMSAINFPDLMPNIFFNIGDKEEFDDFVKKYEVFMKELARLVFEHEILQRKLLDKTKLILDELVTLNLKDLKKYYKKLYDYAKEA